MPRAALHNVRILDLTRVWAGPLGTRIFGDFGADVIKVSLPGVVHSAIDRKLNRNKSNIGLRLDTEEGRNILLQLACVSDVVVENFRPRVMPNLGISYDDLRRENPSIIFCSMPGFGSEGPYSNYPALGNTTESIAGLHSLLGYENGNLLPTGMSLADPFSAINQVAAVMSALIHRRLSGEGQFIDLALAEGTVCMLGEYFVANSVTGHQPDSSGNVNGLYAPHGVYPTAGDDNWVAISVTSNEEWAKLCKLMNREDLGDSASFKTVEDRKNNREEIDGLISSWSCQKDALDIMISLQELGVPAGRVSNNRQFLSDSHLNERDFFVELEEPSYGAKKYPGQSMPGNILSKSDWEHTHEIGEDTSQILSDLLGYSSQQCLDLVERDIVSSTQSPEVC